MGKIEDAVEKLNTKLLVSSNNLDDLRTLLETLNKRLENRDIRLLHKDINLFGKSIFKAFTDGDRDELKELLDLLKDNPRAVHRVEKLLTRKVLYLGAECESMGRIYIDKEYSNLAESLSSKYLVLEKVPKPTALDFLDSWDKVLIEKTRGEMAYSLNNPARWSRVLERFPKLRLNLAHFGGYETWRQPSAVEHQGQVRKETIFDFMEKYEHVYADFSFNIVKIDLAKTLREVITNMDNIHERTLFGTDYWVVNKEGNLLRDQEEFLRLLDQNIQHLSLTQKLTYDNPKRYLGLD